MNLIVKCSFVRFVEKEVMFKVIFKLVVIGVVLKCLYRINL